MQTNRFIKFAAAKTGNIINVKKGQFLAPWIWLMSLKKLQTLVIIKF